MSSRLAPTRAAKACAVFFLPPAHKQSLPPSAGVRSEISIAGSRKETNAWTRRHANNLNGSGSDSGSLSPSPRTDTSIDASRGSSKRKAKRDERRNRMHSINEELKTLKNSLPFIPPDRKLSKIRRLRYPIYHISHLSLQPGTRHISRRRRCGPRSDETAVAPAIGRLVRAARELLHQVVHHC